MARNQTLLKILTDVRGEARLSMNPAHNIADREAQIGLIQREQERLWADHDWPHLRVTRYIPAIAGTRYYDPRNAYGEDWTQRGDLSMERVEDVAVFDGSIWRNLPYGINDAMRFAHNSQIGDVSWPPRVWSRAEDDVIEIWPMPDTDAVPGLEQPVPPSLQGVLRVRGIRDLRPLVDDEDRADLDDRLLVLFCAAALLAESGAKDTNLKLEAATRHFARMKADQDKREPFSLFGARRPAPTQDNRQFVGVYNAPTPDEGVPVNYVEIYQRAKQ